MDLLGKKTKVQYRGFKRKFYLCLGICRIFTLQYDLLQKTNYVFKKKKLLLLFQVRTSYLPNEILWGHQFDHNVLVYDKKMGSYQIFHSRVNKTAMDDTPRLSARQLDMRSKRNSSGLSNSTTTENSPSKKPFKRLPTVA